MQNRRLQRVNELLKRELSQILLREFPVSSVGVVTVNEVRVTGDLKLATVYVGVVGPADQQQRTVNQLVQQRVRLQGLVGAAIVLRETPELRFVLDDSVARGNRVLEILEDIEKTLSP